MPALHIIYLPLKMQKQYIFMVYSIWNIKYYRSKIMENKKMIRTHQQMSIDLPTITKRQSLNRSIPLTEKHQNIVQSPRFKNLRKLFFQYKSNAKILQSSPYYTNRNEQRKLVDLISKNKYDISKEIEEDIERQFPIPLRSQNKQYKSQKVKTHVSFCNKNYSFQIYAETIMEFTQKIKCQLAKVQYCIYNEYKKAQSIILFETSSQDQLIDYCLTRLHEPIQFKQLSIKPVFRKEIKGKVTLADFKFIKCLGSGGFSFVYLVRGNFDGKYYALKLINKNFIIESDRESIVENERYILGELKSPFVTELQFAFQTLNHFVFVVQYCPGGQLFFQLKKVKKMSESQAKFYFLEILIGLNYIHQKRIIYRDLKPQNLLIGDDGHIKIADFGLSKPLSQHKDSSYSFCGSPQYMAPEMLQKSGHSFTLDFYCLGALLYQLVIGIPPYYSLDHEEIYQSILNEELAYPAHTQLSDELKSLLEGLLQKNASKRLGCLYGIKQILIHPWVGKISQKLIEQKKLTPPFLPNLAQFNFDINDIKDKSQNLVFKIQQDMSNLNFETHFNDQFYFEDKAKVLRKKKVKSQKKIREYKAKSNDRDNKQNTIKKLSKNNSAQKRSNSNFKITLRR